MTSQQPNDRPDPPVPDGVDRPAAHPETRQADPEETYAILRDAHGQDLHPDEIPPALESLNVWVLEGYAADSPGVRGTVAVVLDGTAHVSLFKLGTMDKTGRRYAELVASSHYPGEFE